MNFLTQGIKRLFNKKTSKKTELFALFSEYVKAAAKINSIKQREKFLELSKIKNQIDEYYIPMSMLNNIISLDQVDEDAIINVTKHISEIKPELFVFTDLYATPLEGGVLLSVDKQQLSEQIRIVSYKKV